MMKILDVSDDGLVSVDQMRSRLRDALDQAEKTSNLHYASSRVRCVVMRIARRLVYARPEEIFAFALCGHANRKAFSLCST